MSDDWQKNMGLIDWNARLLTPVQILELCETEQGRKQVAEYIMQARCAYTLTEIMDRLGVAPPHQVQQECCELFGMVYSVFPLRSS